MSSRCLLLSRLIATHAVVYARLIIDGKDYGVHEFMVQLRDDKHRPMPGVDVGDIGPKVTSLCSLSLSLSFSLFLSLSLSLLSLSLSLARALCFSLSLSSSLSIYLSPFSLAHCHSLRLFTSARLCRRRAQIGYNLVDNGYARFDYVRVPRFNMLARHQQVCMGRRCCLHLGLRVTSCAAL
jgi:hypothetical protein